MSTNKKMYASPLYTISRKKVTITMHILEPFEDEVRSRKMPSNVYTSPKGLIIIL